MTTIVYPEAAFQLALSMFKGYRNSRKDLPLPVCLELANGLASLYLCDGTLGFRVQWHTSDMLPEKHCVLCWDSVKEFPVFKSPYTQIQTIEDDPDHVFFVDNLGNARTLVRTETHEDTALRRLSTHKSIHDWEGQPIAESSPVYFHADSLAQIVAVPNLFKCKGMGCMQFTQKPDKPYVYRAVFPVWKTFRFFKVVQVTAVFTCVDTSNGIGNEYSISLD